MSIVSIILVFVLEQIKRLDYTRWVLRPFSAWAGFLERRCNAGEYRHGVMAGAAALLIPAGIALAFEWSAKAAGELPDFLFGTLVLYGVMGFRQFSHFYTDIQMALRLEDAERARDLLQTWRREALPHCNRHDITRLSIETAIVDAHRHVFAVLFWFCLLGPVGALSYRMAHLLSETWAGLGAFGRFAQQCFFFADWVPLRLTATAFAVVGNFEDAVYGWRHRRARWRDDANGIILSSGGGALGIRLGILPADAPENAEALAGEIADAESMQSANALVWRAIALWLLVLLVMGLVRLTG